jgi:hypothetical protein
MGKSGKILQKPEGKTALWITEVKRQDNTKIGLD